MPLANPPWVICRNAFSFGAQAEDTISRGDDDQIVLANLMKHSDVVIQSRGSLALDAIAVDSPVISLAYDGELARLPQDSFLLEYNYEHFQPIVAAEGTWLVGSNDALDQAIRAYLRDPTIHAQGRWIVREDHLEPLDGRASKRLIAYLVEAARRARAGELPDGDWAYRGLGDVTWASRQACDVREFVQMGGRIEMSDGGGNG
jgi:CDP-glycerol glycerophosphotransferase (TagB/SpsB family)